MLAEPAAPKAFDDAAHTLDEVVSEADKTVRRPIKALGDRAEAAA